MRKDHAIEALQTHLSTDDFLKVIEKMGIGAIITNPHLPDHPIIYVNKQFETITGYKKEEVLFTNCRFLQGEETNQEDIDQIRKAIKNSTSTSVTLKNYKKDGSIFWNHFIISPIFEEKSSKPTYFISLQFDVTHMFDAKESFEQQIKQLTWFDSLTGLMNIKHFRSYIAKDLQSFDRIRETRAVIAIDINRFRFINESYGEKPSNTLLLDFAERLRKFLPPDAAITRHFADLFIVYLKGDNSKKRTLNEFIAQLNDTMIRPFSIKGETIRLSMRYGSSVAPEDGKSAQILIKNAEMAMNEVKNHPHNTHRAFSDEILDRIQQRCQIENGLISALVQNEFELYYQPKVSSKNLAIDGIEALIRWNDPDKGLISPDDFIPIAEENGFINELGKWVLLEACHQNVQWKRAGLGDIPVSVNISAIQFQHPHFIDDVKQVMSETGIEPFNLEFEITETLLNDTKHIESKLHELKELGISISIDDFGTGYSSIYYLKSLPVDILKIDRTFVQDICETSNNKSLLRSMILLGKAMDLKIIAEGVETKEQLDFLFSNQADAVQGYYYSRPLPANEFIEWLKLYKSNSL
ncbi:EAL domain-containing protein [Salipaludibacillus sp. HK11]|uniref:EAL domain-containing protein n=1 Tax=Salipaludibacillus sp. HK11 TaxID=3394320 RepID=UPI0039FC49CB